MANEYYRSRRRGSSTEPTRDDGSSRSSSDGYRWTCPYCGTSRLNRLDGESAGENAIAALRTHVYASDDDRHGPRNEFPDDDSLTFAEHVVRVEGSG